jgi:ATPase family associated with various cellular activities (AAA)
MAVSPGNKDSRTVHRGMAGAVTAARAGPDGSAGHAALASRVFGGADDRADPAPAGRADGPPGRLMAAKNGPSSERSAALGLVFQRLDAMLARALAQARERFGAEASADAFRGLYISAAQASAALDGPPGLPLLNAATPESAAEPAMPGWEQVTAAHHGWRWLRDSYGLTGQQLDAVLIGLGPEADLRYERLYGYLQDDVTRRRPTVNLALDLITTSAAGKLAARGLFGADAALLRERVLTLVPDQQASAPPLLAHAIAIDEQIADVLLLQGGLDRRLARHCRLTVPEPGHWPNVPLPAAERGRLLAAARAGPGRWPFRLYFHGDRDSAELAAASALAGELQAPLLVLDLSGLPAGPDEADGVLFRAFREASLQGALLYLDGLDALPEEGPARLELARYLSGHPGIAILAGTTPWAPLGGPPLGVTEVCFTRPGFEVRCGAWAGALATAGVAAPPGLPEMLAERFRCGPGQIADAVANAVSAGRMSGTEPTRAALFAAARRQTSHLLAALASKIEPAYGWEDIVLPADSAAQLHELCERVTRRRRVWRDWGFDRKLARGMGAVALFTGPPGTGKTMAAEIIARELGLDLFKIDLSAMISKYIGETEKNLERIFTAAAGTDAILMFDEADALFGKRSQVRDSHDRYANIEVSYLLQRIEHYDGIVILATNLREHLDAAFTRRLHLIIDFPFPDEAERRRIWECCLPPGAPREAGIDFERLGQFQLSGGHIRNVVLHAAFLAAAQDGPIGMSHMLQAVQREHYKMGKVAPEVDLEPASQAPAAAGG